MCFAQNAKPGASNPAPIDQGAAGLKLGDAASGSQTGLGRLMLRLGGSATGATGTTQIAQSPTAP